jgi:hypothetical protein
LRQHRLRRVGALAAGAAVLALAPATGTAAVPTGHNPNGLPAASCFWTGPFTADNPATNYAFPGTEINYWGAKFATPPGARLILRGRYAHARFQSLNAYVDDGVSTNSLADVDTKPDKGSTNPYQEGNRRDLPKSKRRYTVEVRGEPVPANPARNTLYAQPDADGDAYQDILYRVYVPDEGRDRAGDGGLPKPELHLPDGTVLTGGALCEAINSNHDYRPQFLPQSIYDGLVNWPGKDPATNPAQNPLVFEKYFNLNYTLAAYKTPAEQEATDATPMGTQYNNNDARYMTGSFAFAFGEVLVLRGKMPTFPNTYDGAKRMTGGQLREWDMCVIESLVTTRTWRCLFDAQVPLDDERRYTIVVARAEDRPDNAKGKCGVGWLPADPAGDGAGRPDVGALLTRNVLPDEGFGKSSFAVEAPGTAAQVMGAYYPRGTYESRADFEARGC